MPRALLLLSSLFAVACSASPPLDEPLEQGRRERDTNESDPQLGFDPSTGGADAAPPPTEAGAARNLVPNGDFEQGNVQFGSDYQFATTNNDNEGQYTVGKTGQPFNPFFVNAGDHGSGSGLMFIGNGKATPDRVWFSSAQISVARDTAYYFEAWVMNLCCASGVGDGVNPVAPSVLSFYANGQLLGTRTSKKLGVWEGLSTTWSSGTATSVTLKIVNANTEWTGNDFAVDDIYLGTETSIPDVK